MAIRSCINGSPVEPKALGTRVLVCAAGRTHTNTRREEKPCAHNETEEPLWNSEIRCYWSSRILGADAVFVFFQFTKKVWFVFPTLKHKKKKSQVAIKIEKEQTARLIRLYNLSFGNRYDNIGLTRTICKWSLKHKMRSGDPTGLWSITRGSIIISFCNRTWNPPLSKFSIFLIKFELGLIQTSTTRMSAPEWRDREAFELTISRQRHGRPLVGRS